MSAGLVQGLWRWIRDAVASFRDRVLGRKTLQGDVAHESGEADPLVTAPDELWDFYREAPSLVCAELEIHPLSEAASREYSRAIQRFDLGQRLGLIALDDANDSNPFCLVTKGLLRGAVLHLSHDDGVKVCFASLAEFRRSLAAALAQGLMIDELPQQPLEPLADQRGLSRLLVALCEQGPESAGEQLCLHVPLLDTGRIRDVERLARYPDLHVREAVARLLEQRPNRSLEHVARLLAADRMPQVAREAKRALDRILSLGSGAR